MAWIPKPSFAQEVSAPLLAFAPAVAALVLGVGMTQLPLAPTVAPPTLALSAPLPPAAPKTVSAPAPQTPLVTTITHALTLSGPLKHGDWVWDEAGAPAGPIFITVDTAAQMLSVFRGGHEIGVAVITYGADEKPTPLGRFTVTEKDIDHWSNIYEDAPMPFMLRLTDDGITIHGSDDIAADIATNGCVGIPNAFAKLLFEQAKLGTPVFITRGQTLKLGSSIPTA